MGTEGCSIHVNVCTQVTNYPTMANSSHVRSFSSRWFSHSISHYDKSIIWRMGLLQDVNGYFPRKKASMIAAWECYVRPERALHRYRWSTQDAAWKCCVGKNRVWYVWSSRDNVQKMWKARLSNNDSRWLRLVYILLLTISRCASLTALHPTFRRAWGAKACLPLVPSACFQSTPASKNFCS